MIYQFDNLYLDPKRREIGRGDKLLSLQPRIFDLLLYLLENRERVVSKDELLDRLWPGVIVVEGALQRAISIARSSLREASRTECIKTYSGRGYRFVAEVTELEADSTSPETASQGSATAATTAKPSIAVLPFESLNIDASEAYITEGITEDISVGLSRLRCLMVISRASCQSYRGRSRDFEAAAKDLGVRYILTGSVRKSGDRLRVNVELVDSASRQQIWIESFDRSGANVFDASDDITAAVLGKIEPEFNQFEREQARIKLPGGLDAWGAYQRGVWHLYQFTRKDTLESLPLFERACALDPHFAPAHAGVSFVHFSNAYIGYAENWAAEVESARLAADRGVRADSHCPAAHWALGRALFLAGDLAAAIDEFETSIELHPNYAHGFYMLGWAQVLFGDATAALANLEKAGHLSPRDPLSFAFRMVAAMAQLQLGDFDKALKFADQAVRQPNSHEHTLAVLVATLAARGEMQTAEQAVHKILDLRPDYSCARFARAMPYRCADELERIVESLRAAGIPSN